jgi:hypothetical protein
MFLNEEPKTPPPKTHRLVDPTGIIKRTRARLNKQCAVFKSPYCDYVISMAMQGVPYRDIEKWLIEQGEEHRISAPTIWRNLNQTGLQVNLTRAEEKLQKYGEVLNLDLIREMSQNIVTQKERVDRLVRGEEERRKQKGSENYADRRVHQEMALLHTMTKDLHTMLQRVPEDAVAAAEQELRKLESGAINLSADAASVLQDMILNNEITIGPIDADRPNSIH